jgi:hypothetical protein
VGGSHVFWATYLDDGTDNSSIVECDVGGCNGEPTVLVSSPDYVQSLVADASNAYWMSSDVNGSWKIEACPASGCPAGPTVLATEASAHGGSFGSLATDGTSVFWTYSEAVDSGPSVSVALATCPVGGCPSGGPTVLVRAPGAFAGSLVVDGASMYWSLTSPSGGGTITSTAVMKCSLPACAGGPTTLTRTWTDVRNLALTSSTVYWSTYDAILECAIAGCGGTPTQVASTPWGSDSLVAQGSSIYWLQSEPYDGGPSSRSLVACADGSCDTKQAATSVPASALWLTLDATHVFLAENEGQAWGPTATVGIRECAR